MDYMQNFEELLKQAMRNMEDKLYNNLMETIAGDPDDEANKAAFAFIHALNRRGVSSKVIYEAIMDVKKELEKNE